MTAVSVRPAGNTDRTTNPLRPERLADVIGQERATRLLALAIDACYVLRQPLDHTLLVGASGMGKTTLAHTVANELRVAVYQLAAPISFDTLLELRTTMDPGDILFVDEIHLQAITERRGRESITQPEVLFGVMEDRTLTTATGVLPFPAITLIGATTDEGRLPDAFINRFTLRPVMEAYTVDELQQITAAMARMLATAIIEDAIRIFADACGGVPRQLGDFIRTARIIGRGGPITRIIAQRVLHELDVTPDGLTHDQQAMLVFLRTRAGQTTGGELKYVASVNTIATAIGKSRDTKAVALRVEPLLIQRGYVQVTHNGRRLTDAGIARAEELIR